MHTIPFLPDMSKVEAFLIKFVQDSTGCREIDMVRQDAIAAGGKRLRPALVLLAGQFGPEPDQPLLAKAGAIIEMIHLASLIHDDIVDDAPTRRGLPSMQSKYGKSIAVYTGDYFLSRSIRLLFQTGNTELGILISAAVEKMCLGEIGQNAIRHRTDTSIEQYFQNISYKSAALIECSCSVGALLSGCDNQQRQILEQFGYEFGIAFQLRDDLLDLTEDSGKLGKATFMDIREGIYTLPVLYLLQDKNYSAKMLQLCETDEWSDVCSADWCTILHTSGVLNRAKQAMLQHIDRAQLLLSKLPQIPARTALQKLTDYLILPENK